MWTMSTRRSTPRLVPMRAGTITITTMTTTTTTDLLRLLAWLSPAFPTGGYAYSHGLEWAVETREVRHAATLRAWIEDILRHGAGRSDAILLRHAHAASGDPVTLASIVEFALAAQPTRE